MAAFGLRVLVALLLLGSVLALSDPKKDKEKKPTLQQQDDSDKPDAPDDDETITLKFRAFMTEHKDFTIDGRLYKFMKSPRPLQIKKSAPLSDLMKMIATEDFGSGKFSENDIQRYRLIFRGGALRALDGYTVGDYGLKDGDELVLRLKEENDSDGFFKMLGKKLLIATIKYGKFCGPGWGVDNSMVRPIDALDSSCRMHDNCWSYTMSNDCICNRQASVNFDSAHQSCPDSKLGALSKCRLMSKYGSFYFGSTKCKCLGMSQSGDQTFFYNGFQADGPKECGATMHPLLPQDQYTQLDHHVTQDMMREGSIAIKIPLLKIRQWRVKRKKEKDVSPVDK